MYIYVYIYTHTHTHIYMYTCAFLLFIYFYRWIYFVLCLWVFACMCIFILHKCLVFTEARRGVSDPLELEFQTMWATMWVMDTELRSCLRAASALNHWAMSTAWPCILNKTEALHMKLFTWCVRVWINAVEWETNYPFLSLLLFVQDSSWKDLSLPMTKQQF